VKSRDESFEKSEGKNLVIRILVVSLPSASKKSKFFKIRNAVFLERKLQKIAESFCWFDKGSYLCTPNRTRVRMGSVVKPKRSLKEWKQQYVNQAFTVRLC